MRAIEGHQLFLVNVHTQTFEGRATVSCRIEATRGHLS